MEKNGSENSLQSVFNCPRYADSMTMRIVRTLPGYAARTDSESGCKFPNGEAWSI